jgi:hypothetical protein
MLISNTNKEYPDCPFLYDYNTTTCFPIVYTCELTLSKFSKLYCQMQKSIGENKTALKKEYHLIIQVVDGNKEIYISYHTWLLRQLNSTMSIIPTGIEVSSNFTAGVHPLTATIRQLYEGNIKIVKSCGSSKHIRYGIGINEHTDEYAKLVHQQKSLILSPQNSCNFIFNSEDYPINTFFSVISNPTIYASEITTNKKINKCAITLHVTLHQRNLCNIDEIIKYVNNLYGLDVCLQ